MATIHCTVDTCHYWKNGNICDATQILVTSDEMGASQPDSVDALQASTMDTTPTSTCMETCCKTFVEKNSPKIDEDSILKK